jgi:hypothetical protein
MKKIILTLFALAFSASAYASSDIATVVGVMEVATLDTPTLLDVPLTPLATKQSKVGFITSDNRILILEGQDLYVFQKSVLKNQPVLGRFIAKLTFGQFALENNYPTESNDAVRAVLLNASKTCNVILYTGSTYSQNILAATGCK